MSRHLRDIAALLLIASGAIHLQLYFDGYGTSNLARLFAIQVVVCGAVGLYLVATSDDLAGLLGLAVTAASLVAFALSRVGDGIVGFREQGLMPSPQAAVSVSLEVLTLVLLLRPAARTVRDLRL